MRKGILLMLALLMICIPALAHDHIDSGEGYIMYNSYVAPTEDRDGTFGPGTCSVCGAVVAAPVPIPSLSRQRQTAKPTEAPAPAATPVPAPASTPEPAPAVTPAPTAQPAPAGRKEEQKGASGQGNAAPAAPAPARNRSSGGKSSAGRTGGRDLKQYPIFSTRFPWRRLRMTVEPDIRLLPAGRQIWPQPEAVSPLRNLLHH